MQFGAGDAEVKGWSDQEVDEALGYLVEIRDSQNTIQIATTNTTEYLDILTAVAFFTILIAGINLGYSISHHFVIKSKDISPS